MTYWQPQGWPPPPKKRTGLIMGLICALLVVIGGAAVAIVVFAKDSEHPSAAPVTSAETKPADPLWTAKFTGRHGYETELLGSWTTDELVVRGQVSGIVAYKAKSGEIAWQLPTDKTRYCGMSTTAVEGLGVIVFGGPKPGDDKKYLCNQIRAIDVATGTPKWTRESRPATDEFVADDLTGKNRPDISGDVAVAQDLGTLHGLDLKTGANRWKFDTSDHNPVNKEQGKKRGTCAISTWIVTPNRIALEQSCTEKAFEMGGEIAVVTAIDPKTGQQQWATPIPTSIVAAGQGPRTALPSLASAEPPALYLDRSYSKDGANAVLPLDNTTGKVGKEIELPSFLSMKEGREVDRAPHTLIHGDTMITVVAGQADGACESGRGIYAIDLAASKAVWPKPKALACEVSLIGLDGDTVIALSAGTPDEPPSLYRVGIKDGAETHGKSLPQDPGGGMLAGAVHRLGDTLVVLPYRADRREHSVVAMAVPD